jgi:hypothetical protein
MRSSGSAPRLPSSATSGVATNPNGAAQKRRAAAISATHVCSRSAELFLLAERALPDRQKHWERFRPSLQPGAALRRGSAPARHLNPNDVPLTVLNFKSTDPAGEGSTLKSWGMRLAPAARAGMRKA